MFDKKEMVGMGGMIQGVLLDFYGKMFWSRPSK